MASRPAFAGYERDALYAIGLATALRARAAVNLLADHCAWSVALEGWLGPRRAPSPTGTGGCDRCDDSPRLPSVRGRPPGVLTCLAPCGRWPGTARRDLLFRRGARMAATGCGDPPAAARADQLFDVAQVGALLAAAKRDRDAVGAGARGAADAVHVGLRHVRAGRS